MQCDHCKQNGMQLVYSNDSCNCKGYENVHAHYEYFCNECNHNKVVTETE